MNTKRKLLAALLATGVLAPLAAHSQAFPTRPIKLIVPFGPGSGTDTIARMVGEKLGEELKATIVVENRDGAGGVIGTQQMLKSPADGYTIAMISNAATIAPHMYAVQPYDVATDLVPLAKAASMPLSLVTSAQAPFKTLKELLDFAKANPGKVSYATSGKGAQSHLEVEVLGQIYGAQMTDVPYKSVGQAMTDTISYQVSFYFPAFPAAVPHVKAGKLRALAVGASKRQASAPDVPTFAEALQRPGYAPAAWFGFAAPKGTAPEIVRAYSTAIGNVLRQAQVQERLEKMGAEVQYVAAPEFTKEVREESDKWAKVVKPLGLKVD